MAGGDGGREREREGGREGGHDNLYCHSGIKGELHVCSYVSSFVELRSLA